MEQATLSELLRQRLTDAALSVEEMKNDDTLVVVDKDSLVSVAELLKNDRDLGFTTLMNHLGVDYRDRMAVIYNLYSARLRKKVTIKAYLDRGKPEAPTLEPLFPGVSWYERETYDLFGIRFIGHGNLKRLLLPEDWEGFPLRKDYVYPGSYNGLETKRADLLDETGAAGDANV
jgi:NADH-quinone oxidoreductase subunit C